MKEKECLINQKLIHVYLATRWNHHTIGGKEDMLTNHIQGVNTILRPIFFLGLPSTRSTRLFFWDAANTWSARGDRASCSST